MMEQIPVVAVVGPTATGKSALAVTLAEHFDGEVVSADSMQVYRGMEIATASPAEYEMHGIPHHLIGCIDPTEEFSVARYCALAHPILADIHARSKLPILCGGTGLFVDSLLRCVDFSVENTDPAVRAQLHSQLDEEGLDAMLSEIAAFDPASYERLKTERNPRRILRCIEVYRTTGRTVTELNIEATRYESRYRPLKIGLKTSDRAVLYDRIDARVDAMLDMGLLDEAREVQSADIGQTAAMAIGHKELLPYLMGNESLSICTDSLKRATRRYSKRQLTWFLRDDSIHWFDIDMMTLEELSASAEQLIEGTFYAQS